MPWASHLFNHTQFLWEHKWKPPAGIGMPAGFKHYLLIPSSPPPTLPYTQNFNTLCHYRHFFHLPTGMETAESGGTTANTPRMPWCRKHRYCNRRPAMVNGTATDRAFGGLLSGSLVQRLAQITNSTGATITLLTIGYTGEEWRCGTAARTDQLDFQYSPECHITSNGTWTDFNTLDFATPSTATTGAKGMEMQRANRTAVQCYYRLSIF